MAATEFEAPGTERVPGGHLHEPLHDSERLRRRLRRLALDIHDGPMQSLVGLGYGLDYLERQVDDDPDKVAEQLRIMSAELAAAERSLRDLISTLEESGEESIDDLETIANREVAAFRQRSTATVHVAVGRRVALDSHSQAIAIGAVLREALNNVVKHAMAETVTIELTADGQAVTLVVEDDGIGFDPARTAPDRIGLKSMRERLAFLGGTVAIDSRPGGPTLVRAALPRWRAAQAPRAEETSG